MDQRSLKRFQQLLLQQKTELLNKSNMFKEEKKNGSHHTGGDEADLASEEINLNLDIRLRERERILIQKIETALNKISNGTYGLCLQCEEPMETKRLEARPVATLCIACKEDQEDRERVYSLS